jgi:Lar family restriction alleviation protein
MDGAKRCPFCRSHELKFSDLQNPSEGKYTIRVSCRRCQTRGPISKIGPIEEINKMALEVWNDRDGG